MSKPREGDLEAARQIRQALSNLPTDYPCRDEANRAYGRLILGRLRLVPDLVVTLPTRCNKWVHLTKAEKRRKYEKRD